MNRLEAIETLKKAIAQVEWDYPMEIAAALDFAIADMKICEANNAGWISVKDRLPDEHDSLFANNPHLRKNMWSKESDYVIVYARFPDGTGRSTEGKLQDGKWWTRISPALEPMVTHWMPMPEAPKGDE